MAMNEHHSKMLDSLCEEVSRVIDSPYPVSLKPLQQICIHLQAPDICLWAQHHAPQIRPLVTCLIEGLDLWPATVDIIARFAAVTEIHHAILDASPSLLNGLLSCANKDQHTDRLDAVCIALLSKPLPADLSLPASATPFLMRLIDRMLSNTCLQTVVPVYETLEAACLPLRDTFPREFFAVFQDKVVKHLGRSSALDDIDVTLRCLLILSNVTNVTVPNSQITKLPGLTTMQRQMPRNVKAAPTHKLLTGDRGERTLYICAMAVLNACQADAAKEGIEDRLSLCFQVAARIDPSSIQVFLTNRKSALSKLWEKLSVASVPQPTAIAAMAFMTILQPDPETLSRPCRGLLNRWLALSDVEALSAQGFAAWKQVLTVYAAHISEMAWRELTYSLLHVTISNDSHTASRARRASEALELLQEITSQCESLRNEITHLALREHEVLNQLCSSMRPTDDRLVELQSLTVGMFVLAGLSGPQNSLSSCANQLVQKQQQLSRTPINLTAPLAQRAQNKRQFVSQQLPLNSRDWRGKVTETMETYACDLQRSLLAMFSGAVADMESRCEDIELPLRQTEMNCQMLENERDEAFKRISELEFQLQAALEDAKLAHQMSEAASTDLAQLNAVHDSEFKKFEAQMAQLAADAGSRQHALEQLRDEKRQVDQHVLSQAEDHQLEKEKLRQRVSLLLHEAHISKQQVSRSSEERKEVQNELDSKAQDLATHVELVAELECHLKGAKVQAEELQESMKADFHKTESKLTNALAERDGKIEKLEAEIRSLAAELRETAQRLETTERAHNQLSVDLQARAASHEQLQAHLEIDRRSFEEQREQARQLQESLEKSLTSKTIELQVQHEASRMNAEQSETALKELESQLHTMRTDARSFAEQHAQRLRTAEQAAAGFEKNVLILQKRCGILQIKVDKAEKWERTVKQMINTSETNEGMTPARQQVREEPQPSQGSLEECATTSGDDSRASATATSPSKRMRAHQPFKAPSRRSMRESMSVVSRPSTQHFVTSQTILEEKSPNKRLMMALETPVASKQRNAEPSPTRASTLRRSSRRTRDSDGQENRSNEVIETMSGLDENAFDDDNDDETCSI